MATYIYKREDGSTFEINQRMTEPALTTCPTTGQGVKRVITGGSGVVYKGEGWYVKEYKNTGASKPAEKAEAAPAASSTCCGGGACAVN